MHFLPRRRSAFAIRELARRADLLNVGITPSRQSSHGSAVPKPCEPTAPRVSFLRGAVPPAKFTMRMMAATWAAIAIASTALAARESTEATLSQQLNELEPGKPVDCVSLHHVRSSRIIDRTAIIFEARGVLYLNRPTAGAELLVNDKAILTKSESGEICRGEAVQLFDAASGVQSGSVFLGPFVPYRKKAYEEMPYQAPASGY